MFSLNLKPAHQIVKAYYDELQNLGQLDFYTEGAVSPAFAALLRHCAKQGRLTLVEQYPLKKNSHTLRLDGALLDNFRLVQNIIKILDIFRVFYNYVGIGEDGNTPAMRLGRAKGSVGLEDITYFVPST